MKCGTNIKKYEEEHPQNEIFCEECGARFSGGSFCPECGADMSKYASPVSESEFIELDSIDFTAMAQQAAQQLTDKLLAPFEAEQMSNGKYIIKKLKNPDELVISIPDCVQIIGEGAFADSKVIDVQMPEGLIKICAGAFKNCADFETINFPSSLRIIEEKAFEGCAMLDLEPPTNIRIGENAFNGTKPDQIRKAEEARKNEELQKRNFKIENGVLIKYIGDGGCVIIPDGVTHVGNKAFYWCESLTSVVIPGSVTSICDSAFNHCESLKSLSISNSVINIGFHAFYDCTSLKDIYYNGTKAQWQAINKGSNWQKYHSATGEEWNISFTVYCTDGLI